jgi:magnesium transporter
MIESGALRARKESAHGRRDCVKVGRARTAHAPREFEENPARLMGGGLRRRIAVIVDCAHYREGRRQHEGPMDLDQAAEVCRHDGDGQFVWMGLFEPDPAELAEVQARFGLHDLAVEDAQTFHLRPKVELYDDGKVFFAVLRTARYVEELDEVDFGEVSVFLSRRFLITVRQGAASDLHGARERLERRPELLREGPVAALWAILDKIVDDYAPVVEGLERDVEEVEATVFGGSAAATERIYKLRREVTDFYRTVHPLLGPLDSLVRSAYLPVSDRLMPFFRDVNDHLKLVNEEVGGQRDLLAVVLQANMAVISLEQNDISVRQNETMKQLTIMATIFLPLSFITGFFGMNFGWLVNHISALWVFLVFGLGSLAASCAALFVWFRISGATRS